MTSTPELLMVKGLIAECTPAQQRKVAETAAALRGLVEDAERNAPGTGFLALTLVGVQLQSEL